MNAMIRKHYIMLLLFFLIRAMYSIIFLFDIRSLRLLTREDGVIETLGAIMFLISSVGFGLTYFRSSRSKNDHMGQTKLADVVSVRP